MRTNPDSERDEALLDATLNDESWQAASAAFKAEALSTLRARRRLRRLVQGTASAVALVAVTATVAHWLSHPVPAPQQIVLAPAAVPKASPKPRLLTDEELLAAFPKGSCFIAEVDGKKELVFFDPKVEHAYLSRSAAAH